MAIESARRRSYSCSLIGTAFFLPRSFRRMRYVSRAEYTAIDAMIVTANASEPMMNGMLFDPGGATAANSAGKSAVIVVPMFCAIAIAETREPASGTVPGRSSGKSRYNPDTRCYISSDITIASGMFLMLIIEIREREQTREQRTGDHRNAAADLVGQIADERNHQHREDIADHRNPQITRSC